MPAKSSWLQVRVTEDQKRRLRASAEAAGMDLSAFVLSRALGPDAGDFASLVEWMLRMPDSHVPLAEFEDYLLTLPASRGDELAKAPAGFARLTAVQQNFVCAMVEHRAQLWGVHPPAWVLDVPSLDQPIFGGDLLNLRPHHLVVAPVVFRRRNIFVERGLGGRLAPLSPPATPAEAFALERAFGVTPLVPRRRVAEQEVPYGDAPLLTRDQILRLLGELDRELVADGVQAELLMVGGAVMTVVFQAREQTKDIDAVFEPAAPVRAAVARIAARENIAEDWLNDAVAGFVTPAGRFDPFFEGTHLRVFVARADYLLAMKILAGRMDPRYRDADDIRFLCRYLGITSAERAMQIVERYYPVSRLQARHRFALEELLGTEDE